MDNLFFIITNLLIQQIHKFFAGNGFLFQQIGSQPVQLRLAFLENVPGLFNGRI